jgi:large subunit ribosomal protein L5
MRTIKNYFETDLKSDILLKKAKTNVFEEPKLEKITINIGVKEANVNANKILPPLLITKLITQQQPTCTKARQSIANFKLREGKIIGCKTTLRNKNMNLFLEKLIHIVLPQLTELKSMRYKNRKAKNHITLGLYDSSIFPELENQYDLFSKFNGVEITLCSKEKKSNEDNLLYSGLKIKFQ